MNKTSSKMSAGEEAAFPHEVGGSCDEGVRVWDPV